MEVKKYPVFLNKFSSLQNTAIDKFREYIHNLQIRLSDFAYFHDNDSNNPYSDLTEKSKKLYKKTDEILSSIFDTLIPDKTSPILFENESINYIKKIYKELKDKQSIYIEIKKELKMICQNRDPNQFKEIFSSSDVCLQILGIELNDDEERLFKQNLDKLLKSKSEIENPVDIDINFEPSEEKEFLLGQVLSEYCLYNSIELLKKSRSSFKASCNKINDAYKTEIESAFKQLQNQVCTLIKENEELIKINEKNSLKLKDKEMQIEELQELIDIKNTQNKKLSDEILELKGNASTPEIIYNVDDSDDLDTSEIVKFLEEEEDEATDDLNHSVPFKPQNIIPPTFDDDSERESKILRISISKPYAKRGSNNNIQANKEILNKDVKTDIYEDEISKLTKKLKEKEDIITKLLEQYRRILTM